MAIEAYIVAFDIQESGSGYCLPFTKELGAKKEVTVGTGEWEGKGVAEPTKSGLQSQGIKSNVATCKLTEVLASSAAEAVEVVRSVYAQNAGGERAVVKPNETNFRVIV
jgi:hypothetical protein